MIKSNTSNVGNNFKKRLEDNKMFHLNKISMLFAQFFNFMNYRWHHLPTDSTNGVILWPKMFAGTICTHEHISNFILVSVFEKIL